MPYEITFQEISPNIGNPVTLTSDTPSVDISPVTDGSTYSISVVAINSLGIRGPVKVLPNYTVIGKLLPPADVTNFYATSTKFGNYISWNANTEVDLAEYEVRKGSSWDTGEVIQSGSTSTSFTDTKLVSGTQTYWCKAKDTTGNYSLHAVSSTINTSVPEAPLLSYEILGTDYKLKWAEPSSNFAIDHYEIRYGSNWGSGSLIGTTKSTVFQAPVLWGSERIFHIAAIDIAGNIGTSSQISIGISPPIAPVVTIQVVDNNVLLYWTETQATLPVSYYEIRRGATYAGATIIGTKAGHFTTIFETTAGEFTYWVVGIDSAGNYGIPASKIATVNQPPDYQLSSNYDSTFNGTLSGAAFDGVDLSLPHNTTETWEQHFTALRLTNIAISAGGTGYAVNDTFSLSTGTANSGLVAKGKVTAISGSTPTTVTLIYPGSYSVAPSSPGGTTNIVGTGSGLTITPTVGGNWATPQAQIDAGFPVYSQPTIDSGYYEEIKDYGTVLTANKISLLLSTTGSVGTPTETITISVSTTGPNDSPPGAYSWTNYVGVTSVYATNFRYVKVKIAEVSTGTEIRNLERINIKLDSKIINDGGTVSCLSSDSGGTQVNFNTTFVDVISITGTIMGTAANKSIVIDFTDIPNPTGFKILLFNADGSRYTGTVSWAAKGY